MVPRWVAGEPGSRGPGSRGDFLGCLWVHFTILMPRSMPFLLLMGSIKSHRELRVYQAARAAASYVFRLTLKFPSDERFGATAQTRAASRSVSANIGEAWRKRRYPAAFRSKLNESEGEAGETQIWLDTAVDCGYITSDEHGRGIEMYESIIKQLVKMIGMAETFASINTPRPPKPPGSPAPRRRKTP